MHNILSLILSSKKRQVEILKKNQEAIISLAKKAQKPLSFKEAIKVENKISIIAEIKQASPSAGILRKDFSPVEIAKTFQKLKVRAISILTEEEFFLGRLQFISEVKKEVDLPILRKDFIIDQIQILESLAAGADAILLIVNLLSEEKLKKLYNFAKELNLDVLVEVHTERDLRKALTIGAEIIGINNRNLNTLKTDFTTTQKLIPFLPTDVIRVSESGINSLKDVLWLKGLGVDAVLVGEAIMKAQNIEKKIKELNIDFL
ncbi:MAG: indole-3-glycerol phosphate synthase TrpC [Candidatus Omnitrophica bacterium]|nr:indole-3-glycerol phosphate synthase TrpC [Candidatus Omnitrophota bacterium]MCM8830796.1 indole-3-glycerol phosphate synthase TrpC [Candidatus Omnitrophota bacterium]